MIKFCNLYLIIILFLILLFIKYKFLEKKLVNENEKDIFILNNFLSYDDFTKLQNLLKNIKNKNRQDNFLRKGSSISHFEMNDELSEIKDIFRDPKILVKIKEETGMNLQLVTRFDSNQISLLFYEKPNDGMDWHYDGSIYHGTRWAGIYTIFNKNRDNECCSSAQFSYKENNETVNINNPENSLILFRGDKLEHKVGSIKENELRVVVSLLFCDICQMNMNPIYLVRQLFINFIFYGKFSI